MVMWISLQCVVVVLLDHTRLLFWIQSDPCCHSVSKDFPLTYIMKPFLSGYSNIDIRKVLKTDGS